MLRFTIRDVLWLTVVAALATCWYKDRMSMATTMAKAAAERTAEREKLSAQSKAIAVKRREVEATYKSATEAMTRASKFNEEAKRNAARTRPPTAEELERIKAESANLGAPQPKPLPPGYGETPNSH